MASYPPCSLQQLEHPRAGHILPINSLAVEAIRRAGDGWHLPGLRGWDVRGLLGNFQTVTLTAKLGIAILSVLVTVLRHSGRTGGWIEIGGGLELARLL
jgi:hypothetical protein